MSSFCFQLKLVVLTNLSAMMELVSKSLNGATEEVTVLMDQMKAVVVCINIESFLLLSLFFSFSDTLSLFIYY